MTVWLERLRPSDLQAMLPQILLTLDQIRDQAMAPERRLATLRALKDQVESVHAGLPELGPCCLQAGGDRPEPIRTLTLEQRLTRSWCTNLQRLLIDLGQPRYEGQARFAVYREWTLRQLFKGLTEAIERSVRAEQPPASGIWRALHSLYVYLEGRDELVGHSALGHQRFHPGNDYKRLLLVGGLSDYRDAAQVLGELGPRLREWAFGSELRRDLGVVGEYHLLRVDLGSDAPPKRSQNGDVQPYRGWILEPAQAYTDALDPYRQRLRRQAASI